MLQPETFGERGSLQNCPFEIRMVLYLNINTMFKRWAGAYLKRGYFFSTCTFLSSDGLEEGIVEKSRMASKILQYSFSINTFITRIRFSRARKGAFSAYVYNVFKLTAIFF